MKRKMDTFSARIGENAIPADLKKKMVEIREQYDAELQNWSKSLAASYAQLELLLSPPSDAMDVSPTSPTSADIGEPQHVSTPVPSHDKGKATATPLAAITGDSPSIRTPRPRRIADTAVAPETLESDDEPIMISEHPTSTPKSRSKRSADANPITPKVKKPDYLANYVMCDRPCEACAETDTHCWVPKNGEAGQCHACKVGECKCQYEKTGWLPAADFSSDTAAKDKPVPKQKGRPGRKPKPKSSETVQADTAELAGMETTRAAMAVTGTSVGASQEMIDESGVGKKRKLADGTGVVDTEAVTAKVAALKEILNGLRKSSHESREMRRQLEETGAAFAQKIREYEAKLEKTEEELQDALSKLDI